MKLATLAASLCIALPALASPPDGTDPDSPMSKWFRSLTTPNHGMSCCAQSDGFVLDDKHWRVVGDGYEVEVRGATDGWEKVPPSAVLQNTPNPTGGAVVFVYPADGRPDHKILCFVRAAET